MNLAVKGKRKLQGISVMHVYSDICLLLTFCGANGGEHRIASNCVLYPIISPVPNLCRKNSIYDSIEE